MATFSSEFFKNKLVKKSLLIELEENEEILDSIKNAMKTHNIKEATVDLMEGAIKTGRMNTTVGSNYKVLSLSDTTIMNARGHFKLNFDELFGSLHVLAKIGKPETGTLQKGLASSGLKIKMSFYTEPQNPTITPSTT